MESFGFRQLITFPTHIAGNTLDLVFVRDSIKISNIEVYNQKNDLLLSDHFLLEINLASIFPIVQNKQTYCYRKFSSSNFDRYCDDLNHKVSQLVLQKGDSNINNQVSNLFTSIESVLDEFAPKTVCTKVLKTKPFTNQNIILARRAKRRAERAFRKNHSERNKHLLRLSSKNLVNIVRKSENMFYSQKLSSVKNDVKSVYNIINQLLHKQDEKVLPDHSDSTKLANKFAAFFFEKVSSIRSSISSNNQLYDSLDTFFERKTVTDIQPFNYFVSVDEMFLKEIISSIKDKYSSVDDIPLKLIKPTINILFNFILDIVNNSFYHGVFPEYLKLSHITPIVKNKKGDVNSLQNFRPINRLSFLSKIIEKCALVQLQKHISQNDLSFVYQSAYKTNHSCETALLKIYNDVLNMLSPNSHVVMLFLDFSAAFDTVDHSILLQKLKDQYSINGKALKWFESYLTNRKFKVKIDKDFSESVTTNFGVPQGSVLGPVLYSLYTQEIFKIIQSYGFNVHMFADDIQIYFECDDVGLRLEMLKSCFNDIKLWASKNYLKLNDSKSKLLVVSSKLNKHTICTDLFQNFSKETKVRNLGVVIDEKLNFRSQINRVCQTGFYLLKNLRRISSKLQDTSLKILIVKSCILSHIDYCNSLYVFLPDNQIKKLQRLMNSAIRFIYNIRLSDNYSITYYMKKCHFLPVKARIEYKIAMLVYKCFNNLAPPYLQNLIHSKTSLASLRVYEDKFLLKTPKLSSYNYKNRQFSSAAPRIWNKLPQEIRRSGSLLIFQSKLKTYLFSRYFDI